MSVKSVSILISFARQWTVQSSDLDRLAFLVCDVPYYVPVGAKFEFAFVVGFFEAFQLCFMEDRTAMVAWF